MRRPRIRLTVRRVMAEVAVIALALGLLQGARRYTGLRETADAHGRSSAQARSASDLSERLAQRSREAAESAWRDGDEAEAARWLKAAQWFEGDVAARRAFAAHHEALRRRYERAARAPWRPVEPDPPAPPDRTTEEVPPTPKSGGLVAGLVADVLKWESRRRFTGERFRRLWSRSRQPENSEDRRRDDP